MIQLDGLALVIYMQHGLRKYFYGSVHLNQLLETGVIGLAVSHAKFQTLCIARGREDHIRRQPQS